jgi:hypothetical protein
LRASGTLDERALYRIAGIQADDFTNLSAGPAFHVDLQVRRGGVVGRRTGTFVIRPYQNEAVGIWSRR